VGNQPIFCYSLTDRGGFDLEDRDIIQLYLEKLVQPIKRASVQPERSSCILLRDSAGALLWSECHRKSPWFEQVWSKCHSKKPAIL